MTALQQADVDPNPQFPALDSLRFVGALAVLTTHAAFWSGAYTEYGPWGGLLARMDVGVAIFFVLSGFLLSRPWISRAGVRLPGPHVGRYYWKRVLRIFPVYLVTAVLALALIPENDDLAPTDWLKALTLTDIYVDTGPPDGLTQMWSLTTEVAFYVVLPLLMLVGLGRRAALRPRRMLLLALAMWAISLAWLGELSSRVPGAENRAVNEWLPAFLGWFALGMLLSLAHVLYTTGRAPRVVAHAIDELSRAPGVCWAGALGLLMVATTPLAGPTLLIPPSDSEAVVKNLVYAAVGGLLVFTGVFARPGSAYLRLMSTRRLRHLGHISYGIFCIHLPLLHLVRGLTGYELFDGHFFVFWSLTLGLSILGAELLYRLIEKPSMRLRKWRPGATVARPAASATTTR
jgi:peptidoglycan/LPS O-acetylase OafA/YrhL